MNERTFTVAEERFLEDAASNEHWNPDDTVLKLLRAYRQLKAIEKNYIAEYRMALARVGHLEASLETIAKDQKQFHTCEHSDWARDALVGSQNRTLQVPEEK